MVGNGSETGFTEIENFHNLRVERDYRKTTVIRDGRKLRPQGIQCLV